MSSINLYPSPDVRGYPNSKTFLHSIEQLPAAIIDVAKARRNCNAMLEAAQDMKVLFRAHTKTHKTKELTDLQVGLTTSDGVLRLVVSTIAEIDHLSGWIRDRQQDGSSVDIIYGVPVSSTNLKRAISCSRSLQPSRSEAASARISFLLDHPNQVDLFSALDTTSKHEVWIKIDTGYHRSGVLPGSASLKAIIDRVEALQLEGRLVFRGLYSHYGHSYAGDSPQEALAGLIAEFTQLEAALDTVGSLTQAEAANSRKVTLTVGATPTATAAQLLRTSEEPEILKLRETVFKLQARGFELELHAGVYPLLDMQQVATHARPRALESTGGEPGLSTDDLAFTILVEVVSLYNEREKPEALISAGSLALGREPCKSYPGWGIVSPWPSQSGSAPFSVYDPDVANPTGWIVGRISQEHGILTWEGPRERIRNLVIGERLRIWPNHACIAGVGFPLYNIIDSDGQEPERIQAAWVRCRGW